MLCFSAITPHPPIILPEIGKKDVVVTEKTINAMLKLSLAFAESKPDIVIVVSPHAILLHDRIAISYAKYLEGDLGQFGHPEIKQEYKIDPGDNQYKYGDGREDENVLDAAHHVADFFGRCLVPPYPIEMRTYFSSQDGLGIVLLDDVLVQIGNQFFGFEVEFDLMLFRGRLLRSVVRVFLLH